MTRAVAASTWQVATFATSACLSKPCAIAVQGRRQAEGVGHEPGLAAASTPGCVALVTVFAGAVSQRRKRRARPGTALRARSARSFVCVPYGESWAGDTPSICCDGLVPGATMQLSHWTGNKTADRYYGDTSTDIALNFVGQIYAATEVCMGKGARRRRAEEVLAHSEVLEQATVVNNHFDTDGVLSCWTLLNPDKALRHRALFVAAAAAGDFQEWPAGDAAEAGLKLDAAVAAVGATCASNAEKYATVFARLPELIESVTPSDGSAVESPWDDEWARLQHGQALLKSGVLGCHLTEDGVAVVEHPPGVDEQPGPIYHSAFRQEVAAGKVRRYLLSFESESRGNRFIYERPRHSWVQRLVMRRKVDAPTQEVRQQLLQKLSDIGTWAHDDGLTGILRTTQSCSASVDDVLSIVQTIDCA